MGGSPANGEQHQPLTEIEVYDELIEDVNRLRQRCDPTSSVSRDLGYLLAELELSRAQAASEP
jgi:hypothetical protein